MKIVLIVSLRSMDFYIFLFAVYLGGFDITFIIDCHGMTGTFAVVCDVVRSGDLWGMWSDFCASHPSTRGVPQSHVCRYHKRIPVIHRLTAPLDSL